MIKSVTTFLALAAFISMAIFGFAGMNHGNSHGGCIAATAGGVTCPDNSGNFIDFHAGVFKSFSTALIGGLGVLLVLFAVTFSKIPLLSENLAAQATYLYRRNFDLALAPASRKILLWHRFHQNSPSFS